MTSKPLSSPSACSIPPSPGTTPLPTNGFWWRASDVFARSIGEDLGAFYKQHILIDNRTGAGGLIGNLMVSKASADGYTLGMVDVTRIITELMRDHTQDSALRGGFFGRCVWFGCWRHQSFRMLDQRNKQLDGSRSGDGR